jgi:tRNA threonylcarbamoyladenosine biosynthesis protein TsaB
MRVLGLDTATQTAGIAVVDDDLVLAEATHDASRRSADLLVAIDDVCRRANLAPTSLDAIAIGAGPGSFTGLRIGMATAKGIAFAAGKPLWAVSSLAALVEDAGGTGSIEGRASLRSPRGATIVAVLDARRGEVFAGCYRDGVLLGEERVMAPGELAPWVATLSAGQPVTYAGDALAAYPELASLPWSTIKTPSGRAVAHLALRGPRTDILVGGAPTYIRASEAEIMYPDGVPGALRRRD